MKNTKKQTAIELNDSILENITGAGLNVDLEPSQGVARFAATDSPTAGVARFVATQSQTVGVARFVALGSASPGVQIEDGVVQGEYQEITQG